jgi:acetyltransferase-like isoleucine patch superfamily enzyme
MDVREDTRLKNLSGEQKEGWPAATSSQELRGESFIRYKMFDKRKSVVHKYGELVIDKFSYLRLLKYEVITTLFGPLPGTLGLLMRRIFYPLLFKEIGKGVVFGRNVVLRHANKIRIGARVIIDDYSFLDARGAGEDGIVIEDDVIISRGCCIQAKVGPIQIGRKTEVGMATTIVSQGGVYIDERVSIGGGCKISGGLFEMLMDEDADPPYRRYSKGPVRIEKRCLLAMGVIILDGVNVGEGSMVGSGAVVSMNLPRYSISSPRPAIVLKNPLSNEE